MTNSHSLGTATLKSGTRTGTEIKHSMKIMSAYYGKIAQNIHITKTNQSLGNSDSKRSYLIH